jgi:hypothetical protein
MKMGHLLAVEPSPPFAPRLTWQQVADDFCDPGPSDFGTEHSRFLDEFGNFGSDLLKWVLACAFLERSSPDLETVSSTGTRGVAPEATAN